MSKIVYSYYVLDVVHKGHLLMMKNSKALAGEGGQLVVGVLTDEACMEKKPKPIISFEERLQIAEAIRYVDVAIPQNEYSPYENIINIKPDILMESESHKEKDIDNMRKVVSTWGGKVIVLPYYPYQSSTDIKNKIKEGKDEKVVYDDGSSHST